VGGEQVVNHTSVEQIAVLLLQDGTEIPSEPACQRACSADEELARALQPDFDPVGGEQVVNHTSDEQLARELSRVWTDTHQPRTRSARDTIASAEPVVQQQEYGQQQRVETPNQPPPDNTDHPPVNSHSSVPTSQRRPGNKKGSNGKGSTIVSVGTIAGVRTPKTLLPSHLEVHA